MLLEFILLGNSIISPISRSLQMTDRREGWKTDTSNWIHKQTGDTEISERWIFMVHFTQTKTSVKPEGDCGNTT